MKVYALPVEVPWQEPEYSKGFDWKQEQAREQEHQQRLAEYLRSIGYTGKHTGGIYRTPVADGCAQYMLGDKGRSGILIHLPYGDAWQSRDVQFLPKSEIVARIEQANKRAALFSKA